MPDNPMPADRLSTVDEQVERILEALTPLEAYDQPLLEALNLPVCETVAAPMDLPSFDNSAMDGYAVLPRRRGDRHAGATRCTCRWWGRWPPGRPRCSP